MSLSVIKAGVDAGAAGAIVASLAGWLPPLAAGLAIVWYLIQIAESATGQAVIQRVKEWISRRDTR